MLISGGTNSFTGNLARQLKVNFNGITIGTHARKVISNYRDKPKNIKKENLISAIMKAKELINLNLVGEVKPQKMISYIDKNLLR